jgi:hypothetical protein
MDIPLKSNFFLLFFVNLQEASVEVDALGDEVEESEPVAHPGHRSRSALGEMGRFSCDLFVFFFQFSLDFGGEFWTVMIC